MADLILDILILDTHDVKTLGIGDISTYPIGVTIVNPSIQITPPSALKVTLPFTAKNLTIYNSNTLGITCSETDCDSIDLPDGIYQIKYTITPADTRFVEKSFLRTEQIQRDLGIAFLSTGINQCGGKAGKIKKEQLDDIMNLIQGAIADSNNCNAISAMNKYVLASSLLQNFNKNC